MRKDYDSLVTSSQKNTYELRSIADSLKRDAQSIQDVERKVAEEIAAFSFKVNGHQLQSEKQFVQGLSYIIQFVLINRLWGRVWPKQEHISYPNHKYTKMSVRTWNCISTKRIL